MGKKCGKKQPGLTKDAPRFGTPVSRRVSHLKAEGLTTAPPILCEPSCAEGPAPPPGTVHAVGIRTGAPILWFHLSMRVQHVTQTARSWPRGTKEDLQYGCSRKKIDRIRWLLWHGRPQGARDLIAEILEELETPKRQIQLTVVYIKKLTGVLRDLET
jgi:hypothetical protein